MSEIRVGYFLEDVGQQQFVVALVERVAVEVGLVAAAPSMNWVNSCAIWSGE